METPKKEPQLYVFVGERRSERAIRLQLTWESGGLAAKPLFEALRACGIPPENQLFKNLWIHPADLEADKRYYSGEDYTYQVLDQLDSYYLVYRRIIVALGHKVSAMLIQEGIPHIILVHPAARGAIRRAENYQAHVLKQIQNFTRGKGVDPRWLR